MPPASREALSESAQLGPAMSRWTQGVVPDELLEELGRRDGPAPLAADVLQVGDLALERLLVIVVERQPPGALAGLPAGASRNSWQKASSLLKRPAILGPQRDHAGAGQRGQVEEPVGLLLDGEAEGIGQDQPPLGVGVQDLDGLAVADREDVAELHGPAAGHVLGDGEVAGDVDGQVQPGGGLHRRGDDRRAGHVALHVLHRGAGLELRPPESNVTPLPTRASVGRIAAAAVVEHDEPRGLVRAGGDAQQAAEPLALDALGVPDVDRESGILGDQSDAVGQLGRRLLGRRRVGQVAGQVDRLADDLAPPQARLERSRVASAPAPGATTRDSEPNGWRFGSVLRRPGPRVPTISPSTIAEAIAAGSSDGGQTIATSVAGLPASRLAAATPAVKAAPASNRPARAEPDQQDRAGGDARRLMDRRHLAERPADLLRRRAAARSSRPGPSSPGRAARRPRPRTDPGSATATSTSAIGCATSWIFIAFGPLVIGPEGLRCLTTGQGPRHQ